jgi:hypothetical protein
MNEIFDNYKKLPLSSWQKTKLQLNHYRKQSWRLWKYRSQNNKTFFKAFINIWLSQNSTFGFKLIFPFWMVLIKTNEVLKSFIKKIICQNPTSSS